MAISNRHLGAMPYADMPERSGVVGCDEERRGLT